MNVSFEGKPAAAWYHMSVWRELGRLKIALIVSVDCIGSSGSFQSPVASHRGASRMWGLVAWTAVVVAS